MAFIPVANCVQAQLRLTYLGQEVENVLHFRTPAAPTAGDLAAIGEGLEDWWLTSIRPNVPNGVIYREVYCSDITSQNGAILTVAGASGTAGQLSLSEEPTNVTLAISLRTGLRGRSFRGRIYHIGIGQLDVVDNEITPTRVAALRTAYGALLTVGAFGNSELAVASRYANKQPRAMGIATVVNSIVIADTVVDSQRRRLPGRGR